MFDGKISNGMVSLLIAERLGGHESEQRMNDVRTPYEIDVDRIAFSNSFRRLSRKTRVHPFCKNDHVHTRLTTVTKLPSWQVVGPSSWPTNS